MTRSGRSRSSDAHESITRPSGFPHAGDGMGALVPITRRHGPGFPCRGPMASALRAHTVFSIDRTGTDSFTVKTA